MRGEHAAAAAVILGALIAAVWDHVPRLWRERCRHGLTRHKPVKVITSARVLSVTAAGVAFAEVNGYHRCRGCGVRLNPNHPEIRPI